MDVSPRSSDVRQPVLPVKTETPAPCVYDFTDSRKFLSAWWEWKKTSEKRFSGQAFAKRAGFKAHNLFQLVSRGERNLSAGTIRAFSRGLELNSRESLYFEKLVDFTQSTSSEDRQYYFRQMLALAGERGRSNLLSKVQGYAKFVQHWYIVAIRELVHVAGFRADPEWISKRLKSKVTVRQAREAWDTLVAEGLVARDPADGERWVVVNPSIEIHPSTVDFAVRNFHGEFLQRARDAIDGEPIEDRELSSLTLTVSEEDLEEIRFRIREFRRALNQEFPRSRGAREHVIAVNSQVLVLTDKSGEKRL